jgi:hypothetical protein
MSTKGTLAYGTHFHLYTDLADEFPGAHAYLRIDAGQVKRLSIEWFPPGLSVTIRLPPEVFAILRPDLAKRLRRLNEPITPDQFERGTRRLERLLSRRRRDSSKTVRKGAPADRRRSSGGEGPRTSGPASEPNHLRASPK